MRKQVLIFALLLFAGMLEAQPKNTGNQMKNNLRIGWDVNRTDDYRWRNFNLGIGFGKRITHDPRASVQLGVDMNWSKYTLYADGDFAFGSRDAILTTRSLSFPLLFNYDIYRSFFTGMRVYTGPVYEYIFTASLNKTPFNDYRPSQWGWTVGTRVKFLAVLSGRLAYNFYPTALFSNGEMNRSAVSFSIGF